METMQTLAFDYTIKAPKEKVWDVLWKDESYRKWTAAFCEGSYAESDWQEGSEIRFLTPDGTGMYSRIKRLIPYEEMSFEHEGEIMKGEKKAVNWGGAQERYFLKEKDGVTQLHVETDVVEQYRDYMEKHFPLALQKVKELLEA